MTRLPIKAFNFVKECIFLHFDLVYMIHNHHVSGDGKGTVITETAFNEAYDILEVPTQVAHDEAMERRRTDEK